MAHRLKIEIGRLATPGEDGPPPKMLKPEDVIAKIPTNDQDDRVLGILREAVGERGSRSTLRAIRASLKGAGVEAPAINECCKRASRYLAQQRRVSRQRATPLRKAAAPSICFMFALPRILGDAFPSKGQDDPSPPHVTLLYLPELKPEHKQAFNQAVDAFESGWAEPAQIAYEGLGHFDNEDGTVAYARVMLSPGLRKLRGELVRTLKAHGVPVRETHPVYIPHVTISYLSPGERWSGHTPSGMFVARALRISGSDAGIVREISCRDDAMKQALATLHAKTVGEPVVQHELPAFIGDILMPPKRLAKAQGHKYLKRIPTGNPKRPWRYVYRVNHAGGVANVDHFKIGAAFKVEHQGKVGHFHITGRRGDTLTVKHDESGQEAILHVEALAGLLREQHAEAIGKHRDKIKREIKAASKHGSKKQRDRLIEEARRAGHDGPLTADELEQRRKAAKASAEKRRKPGRDAVSLLLGQAGEDERGEALAKPGLRFVFNSPYGTKRGEVIGERAGMALVRYDNGTETSLPFGFFQPEPTTHASRAYPEPPRSAEDIEEGKRRAAAELAEDEARAKAKSDELSRRYDGWHKPKDRTDANRRFREVLQHLPGLKGHEFSVRGSRGTGYGWIHVSGKTPEADRALHAFRAEHNHMISIISPDMRESLLRDLEEQAGLFVPGEGHKPGSVASKHKAKADGVAPPKAKTAAELEQALKERLAPAQGGISELRPRPAGFESPVAFTGQMIEGTTKKRGTTVYTVPSTGQISREQFGAMSAAAKSVRGYWLRGRGFTFRSKDDALRFMSEWGGGNPEEPTASPDAVAHPGQTDAEAHPGRSDAEAHEALEASRTKRRVNRLREVAQRMITAGEDSAGQDRLANTPRRARMAASAEEAARGKIASGRTLMKIADAVEKGEATHLRLLGSAASLATLDSEARQAVVAAERARNSSYSDQDFGRAYSPEDAAHVTYPAPWADSSRLFGVLDDFDGLKPSQKRGAAQAAKELRALARATTHRERGEHLNERNTEALRKVYGALKRAGKADTSTHADEFKSIDRLKRMGINNKADLVAALAELSQIRSGVGEDLKPDPVVEARRKLIGRKIPGYFPTPKPVADRVVALADVKPGQKVLEPSAGAGHLIDAIEAAEPKAKIEAIERDHGLREVLQTKGVNLIHQDHLAHEAPNTYDRIVMNPPFEGGADADHVRAAYDKLKPGGKLVAIVSEGLFFRNDKKAGGFRAFLDEKGGASEKVAAGAFKASDNPTGVNTRIVTLTKPEEPRRSHLRDEADALLREAKRLADYAMTNPGGRMRGKQHGLKVDARVKAGVKASKLYEKGRDLEAQADLLERGEPEPGAARAAARKAARVAEKASRKRQPTLAQIHKRDGVSKERSTLEREIWRATHRDFKGYSEEGGHSVMSGGKLHALRSLNDDEIRALHRRYVKPKGVTA